MQRKTSKAKLWKFFFEKQLEEAGNWWCWADFTRPTPPSLFSFTEIPKETKILLFFAIRLILMRAGSFIRQG